MQPESKPLSIPDFNLIPMKPIQLLTLTACCLLFSFYSYSQNLQFNSAVFYEYGGGIADGGNANVVTSGSLVIAPNQVLKITSAKGTVGSIGGSAYFLINNRWVDGELYLPAGTYAISITDFYGSSGEVKGYISGVLYDIVP
jgi:hypothetical protein